MEIVSPMLTKEERATEPTLAEILAAIAAAKK